MRKEEGRRRGEGKEEGRCKKEEGRRRRRGGGKEEGRRRKGGVGGGRERGIKKGKRLEEGKYNQTDILYKGYKQMVFQVMLTS